MADPKGLAQEFSKVYYETFDSNRQGLVNFYHEGAKMTFEGEDFEGREKIGAKLTTLSFQTVSHVITTVDAQPIPGGQGAIIMVVGQLKTDNDQPHGFTQVFTIFPCGSSFVIVNDVFRLALHNYG